MMSSHAPRRARIAPAILTRGDAVMSTLAIIAIPFVVNGGCRNAATSHPSIIQASPTYSAQTLPTADAHAPRARPSAEQANPPSGTAWPYAAMASSNKRALMRIIILRIVPRRASVVDRSRSRSVPRVRSGVAGTTIGRGIAPMFAVNSMRRHAIMTRGRIRAIRFHWGDVRQTRVMTSGSLDLHPQFLPRGRQAKFRIILP
mmetsp:Transcript_21050/g.45637  ORF Transcript_21050/g.45637 Transcript_21050/m.45637 type:complete len:202 (-) Transcript_21050:232-837(-)